jgi:hypothetical protein
MKYSIDTSVLIFAHRVNFPMDIAPGFWNKLTEGISTGDIRATELVSDELKKKEGEDDELYKWAKLQTGLYVPIDGPIQEEVTKILKRHPLLVNLKKGHSGADPFVIALAKIGGCTVITQEEKSGPGGQPMIPNVCGEMDVECINLLTLCRREGWRFS